MDTNKETTRVVNYDALDFMCRRLAMKIKGSKEEFDCILAVSGGGLFVAHSLSHHLDIPEVLTIGLEYPSRGERRLFTHTPNPFFLIERDVLIVDIMSETGTTIKQVRNFLHFQNCGHRRTAVLFSFTWDNCLSWENLPDFCVEHSKEPIKLIFPWTKREG